MARGKASGVTDQDGDNKRQNKLVDTRTDQMINEAVARKLGWRQCVHDHGNEIRWNKPEMVNCAFRVPDYCHSISAAWEVVESSPNKEWECWFRIDRGIRGYYAGWYETIHGGQSNLDSPLSREWADTAPMAICLAFLKLP